MRLTRLRRLAWPLLLAAPLLGVAFVVSAQPAEPASSAASAAAPAPAPLPSAPKPTALSTAPGWAELGPAQRTILGPLEPDWAQMNAEHRGKWLAVANRISALPVEDQARLQERMRDWARVNPVERRQARVRFLAAMQLDAEHRRAKWEAYQALPPERRAELAARAIRKRSQVAPTLPLPPESGAQIKSNLVPPPPTRLSPTAAVSASLVQAKPGATTVLITRAIMPPLHQEAGQPKVIADPQLVDPRTLLPKTLQSAASVPAQ